jgi:hypothetical protein
MSHRKIRLLYQARLADWAQAQGLRVAYQGVAFDPEDGETYLQAYLLPAGTDDNTLGGDLKTEDLVDELADLFPLYLRLGDVDFTVIVLTPVEQGPGIVNDPTYTVSASFQYRADTD